MHREDLNALTGIERAATPAPWFVRALNDDACMSGVGIATTPDPLDGDALVGDWPDTGLVAACLLQSPPYIIPDDGLYHQNAELIAAMRNAMPKLLRLASIGLQHDHG